MKIKNIITTKNDYLNKLSALKDLYINYTENEKAVELDEEITQKIEDAIKNIESNTFIIAMFGAFSDGKSSIIKSLTNEEGIEIAPEPTTSEIKVFNVKLDKQDSVVIVDTPGMFSDDIKHTAVTKKYISEANIILYSMDAANPLKDSQRGTISWLLNDLKKVNSTIFLINKMDTVTDLDDEIEYKNSANIKVNQVYETLSSLNTKVNKNFIIPLSADPYGMGLDYWKGENLKEYVEISNINNVKKTIDSFISKYNKNLINQTAISVIEDIVRSVHEENANIMDVKSELINIERNQLDNIISETDAFTRKIDIGYRNIKSEFISLRESVLMQIDNCNNMKDLSDFYTYNIGEESYLLTNQIENIIQEHTDSLIDSQKIVIESIRENANSYDGQREILSDYTKDVGKKAMQVFSKIPKGNLSKSILKTRDVLKVPIKFKPWGAINLASKLKVAGGALSIGFELYDSISQTMSQSKFEATKVKETENFKKYFKGLDETFSFEEYQQTYFPIVTEYQESIKESEELIQILEDEIKNLKEFDDKFSKLR